MIIIAMLRGGEDVCSSDYMSVLFVTPCSCVSVPASCSLSLRDEEVSHSTGNTTDMSDASMHLCLGVFLVRLGLNADIENII